MPQKQNRKIVRIGKTSLAVILPKPWLRYYNLEAGDQVEVISNNKVTVRSLENIDQRTEK
jgi:antitoxin component of MazEF toxin-antitoxin module